MTMTAADRSRRWRQRQRDHLVMVQCELHEYLVDALVQAGFLPPDQIENRAAIGAALIRQADAWAFRFAAESRAQNSVTRCSESAVTCDTSVGSNRGD